ncbi:MAG: NYN domain-containing protein [Chloroflexota bacterium]|nr:NYN domain-containing protein [Chloroflexota bacterium]
MPGSRPTPVTVYGRFALFIDGANFYHTLRDLQLRVDYRRLLAYFCARGELVRAHYYTPLLAGQQAPAWLIRLTDWLAYNGYHVVTKPAKAVRRQVEDVHGVPHWVDEVQGNVAIELAVDMFTLAPHCDTLVLFSGDGTFVRLVEALQAMGCRVVVVSSQQTAGSTVADELRRQADTFLELAALAHEIAMLDKGRQ